MDVDRIWSSEPRNFLCSCVYCFSISIILRWWSRGACEILIPNRFSIQQQLLSWWGYSSLVNLELLSVYALLLCVCILVAPCWLSLYFFWYLYVLCSFCFVYPLYHICIIAMYLVYSFMFVCSWLFLLINVANYLLCNKVLLIKLPVTFLPFYWTEVYCLHSCTLLSCEPLMLHFWVTCQ